MSLESAIAKRNDFLLNLGKNALNVKYPKEFELYIIALELTDVDFNTLQYFIFPVNPSSMEELQPQITNVRKTLGGITVLKNPTFIPVDITLTGTFGRSFKVLIGANYEDINHAFVSRKSTLANGTITNSVTSQSVVNGLQEVFDPRVKTGYGCLKILEDMVKSSKLAGTRLILHNPAIGNSYLVTAGSLRQSMNEQSNMLWNYNLPLKAVAPLESVYTKQQMESAAMQLNLSSFVQKSVNTLRTNVSKLLGDSLN